MIAVILAIRLGAGFPLRAPRRAQPLAPAPGDPAVEVLKYRYARGEIDHDEFETRLDALLRH